MSVTTNDDQWLSSNKQTNIYVNRRRRTKLRVALVSVIVSREATIVAKDVASICYRIASIVTTTESVDQINNEQRTTNNNININIIIIIKTTTTNDDNKTTIPEAER
jgi:hypothetical protein